MTFLDLEKKVTHQRRNMITKILSAFFTTGKLSSEVRHTISGIGGAAIFYSILTVEQATKLTEVVVDILTSQSFYAGLGAFLVTSVTSRLSDKQKSK